MVSFSRQCRTYNSHGCANRSGGPPKPGRRLLSGVRRCRRRSVGVRRVPMGLRRALGGAVGSRMGPYTNCAPIRDSRATHRAPAGDDMLRAALVVAHFCSGRKPTCPKHDYFLVYCNSPSGYAHSNCTAILCKGVWSIRNVIVPLSKPIAMRHHR